MQMPTIRKYRRYSIYGQVFIPSCLFSWYEYCYYKLTLNLKVEETIEYLIEYNLFILPIKLYGSFEGFDKYVHIER